MLIVEKMSLWRFNVLIFEKVFNILILKRVSLKWFNVISFEKESLETLNVFIFERVSSRKVQNIHFRKGVVLKVLIVKRLRLEKFDISIF